jgi:hypothetical protein
VSAGVIFIAAFILAMPLYLIANAIEDLADAVRESNDDDDPSEDWKKGGAA